MQVVSDFNDYEIIDSSCGEKLERWGNICLLRPDPQIIWNQGNLHQEYNGRIHAIYHRSNKGGGYWEDVKSMPDRWVVHYQDLKFCIKKMGFKHTGLFPEQAINWKIMREKIGNANRPIKVLNLFAYTGGATIACLKAGASVVHVDSSRGMIDWAKENVQVNHLEDAPVRFLIDDVLKFVRREVRRGNQYDAIIMDPPSFGRGANGEVWNIEESLDELLSLCCQILSDEPLFFLINSYTAGYSKEVMVNMLKLHILKNYEGDIDSYEIGLPITKGNLVLPCGISARVDFK